MISLNALLGRPVEYYEYPWAIEGRLRSAQSRPCFFFCLLKLQHLFKAASTPQAMAALTVKRIERLIYPVSFYRNKAKHVKATCRILVEQFNGRVPGTMEELLTLPGVGRKTANLVLILAFKSAQNICVDTHVHRISNRLGWVKTKTPDETEQALYAATAREWWPSINLYLVTWGQNVWPVYPRCGACVIREWCPQLGVTTVGRS